MVVVEGLYSICIKIEEGQLFQNRGKEPEQWNRVVSRLLVKVFFSHSNHFDPTSNTEITNPRIFQVIHGIATIEMKEIQGPKSVGTEKIQGWRM